MPGGSKKKSSNGNLRFEYINANVKKSQEGAASSPFLTNAFNVRVAGRYFGKTMIPQRTGTVNGRRGAEPFVELITTKFRYAGSEKNISRKY